MKFRTVPGALLIVFGLAALVYGIAFVQGPLLYWQDPFEAASVQLHAMITGAAAIVIGALTVASTRWKVGRRET